MQPLTSLFTIILISQIFPNDYLATSVLLTWLATTWLASY
jgi:hypothetical protein